MLPAQTNRRRFDVHQYHRMAEAGILSEDDRVELIDGEVVEMAAVGGRHIRTVNRLTMLLAPAAAERGLAVSVQNPLRLGDETEPEPDLALIRETFGGEVDNVPVASEALLVIEVAETSLSWDRSVKVPRYAGAGIPEVWLVDLASETIEVYTGPPESSESALEEYRYATARTLRGDDELTCNALGSLSARVREVL